MNERRKETVRGKKVRKGRCEGRREEEKETEVR